MARRQTLFSKLSSARDIVRGGNPHDPKARKFIAATIDDAMMFVIRTERLVADIQHANALRDEQLRRADELSRRSLGHKVTR
jgi:hypothetical protein